MNESVFCLLIYSSGSGCPFPRRANRTTARAIATPIAAPNAAIPASAISKKNQFNDHI